MSSVGTREALTPLLLRIVSMIRSRHLVDGAKNVIREWNEQPDQGKGADQHQKHQQNFQSHFPPARDLSDRMKRLSPDTDSSQGPKSKGASANCRQMGMGVSPESSMRDSHRRGRLRIDSRIPIGNLIG